jgi:ComF family protein
VGGLGKVVFMNNEQWTIPLKIKRALLDALFPIHCLGCEKEGCWLCPDCRGAICAKPLFLCPGCGCFSPGGTTHVRCAERTPLSALVSPYHYANPTVRRLIKEYKYHGAAEIEKILIALTVSASEKMRTLLPQHATVVALPLHASRERMRGFNQAATIANALAGVIGAKTGTSLKRLKRTEEQARLKTAERHENCQKAFSSTPIAGDVVLVDDVITSGATMRAAAMALKEAGARTVTGFALAHGRGNRLAG